MAQAKKKKTVRGISPNGRVAFPKLFQAEAMDENSKPKFQITLSFVPDELDAAGQEAFQSMVDAANECSKDLFGVGYKEKYEVDGEEVLIRSPFRSGKASKYHEDNEVWIRFSTFDRPDVIDGLKEAITEESGQMYAGAIARVSWTCSAYDQMGNRGVTFYLGNVQKTGKGERLTGGPSAKDEFDAVEAADVGSDSGDGVAF